jgi:hypothetical protein
VGITCDGSSGTHMRCQFWDSHAMSFLGTTCDGSSGTHMDWSCGDHIRMAVLGPTCDVIARDHIRMAVLGTTYDGSSGDNMRYHFWRPHSVSVFGSTSYTGVKLKSPPSDARILNCHKFIL